LAENLRVVNSNTSSNLQVIFDPGLPQKFQHIFPARLKSVPLMIDFARRPLKIRKKLTLTERTTKLPLNCVFMK